MKNITIKVKIGVLIIVALLGYGVVSGVVYNQLNSIKLKYDTTKKINATLSAFKSILIGGLMVNSATNVYVLDNENPKPLKTVEKGIAKIKTFSKQLRNVNSQSHAQVSSKLQSFLNIAETTLEQGKTTNQISIQDAKKLLKPWRELKFVIQKATPVLKKESKRNETLFYETLTNSVTILLIIMLLGGIAFFILSMLISKTITNGLNSLHEGVLNLLNNKDTSSRVELKTEDELGKIACDFNGYLDSIEKGVDQDTIVINEVSKVVSHVKSGILNERVKSNAHNPAINSLTKELNSMMDALQGIIQRLLSTLTKYQNGDFREKTSLTSKGDIEQLVHGIDDLGCKISEMLAENKSNGLTLDIASDRLIEYVVDLNKNSTDAAARLEETSAAIEEVTGNVSNTTQNVVEMSKYAQEVSKSAQIGQELSNKTDKAMDEINEQVTAINDAITVIDQISFQTNILSLNAAVEAATAGESGKGFAVVAQEVRNLASRSAEAAKEIKNLVEVAKEKADDGKQVAYDMTQGYETLYENIHHTSELITDIENASKEQQEGIVQINDAINSLDKQTQENANIASLANEIAKQTDSMAKLIVENANEKEFIGKDSVQAKTI